MSEEFVIREAVIAEDAEKLAIMWKASDSQWPGTWSGGTDITPQMVTEWYERESMLNVHVVETEDGSKIVGYCSFNERPEEKGVGHIDLLNVRPEATLTRTAFLALCQGLAEARRYVALKHYRT